MTIFEFVTVAISIIFGIAMSRLLSAGIELFRHRNSVELSWISIVWAINIFCLLIILWWQIFGISQQRNVWTNSDFNLTVAMAVSLYIASSLILPSRYDERDISLYSHFRKEGRWGLASYAIFFIIAIIWNWRLFGRELFAWSDWDHYALIAILFGTIISKSARQVGLLTAIFMIIHVANIASVRVTQFGS
jgi:hypothetical protein